jgi:hypothetical protein
MPQGLQPNANQCRGQTGLKQPHVYLGFQPRHVMRQFEDPTTSQATRCPDQPTLIPFPFTSIPPHSTTMADQLLDQVRELAEGQIVCANPPIPNKSALVLTADRTLRVRS